MKPIAKAKINKVYIVKDIGSIAGCYLLFGEAGINSKVKLTRGKDIIWEGWIESIQISRIDVQSIKKGNECGIKLKGAPSFQEGDFIEFWDSMESTPKLKNVVQKKSDQQNLLLRAKINKVFNIKNIGIIAGCKVFDGKADINSKVKLFRGKNKYWEGWIESIQIDKKDVTKLQKGDDCGILFKGSPDFLENDIIELYANSTNSESINDKIGLYANSTNSESIIDKLNIKDAKNIFIIIIMTLLIFSLYTISFVLYIFGFKNYALDFFVPASVTLGYYLATFTGMLIKKGYRFLPIALWSIFFFILYGKIENNDFIGTSILVTISMIAGYYGKIFIFIPKISLGSHDHSSSHIENSELEISHVGSVVNNHHDRNHSIDDNLSNTHILDDKLSHSSFHDDNLSSRNIKLDDDLSDSSQGIK